MNSIDPNKNCHEYCPIAKYCRFEEGSQWREPEECGMYYKLLDLIHDANDIKYEQERRMQVYDDEDDIG